MTTIDPFTIDAASEAAWRTDPTIRAEFGDLGVYRAFCKAEAAGLVKLIDRSRGELAEAAAPRVSEAPAGLGFITGKSGMPIAWDDSWPEDRKTQARRIADRTPGAPNV
jgi:hypothetical protein